MDELLTLNIFAHSLGAALFGVGLFGGLILLPLWFSGNARQAIPANCFAQPG